MKKFNFVTLTLLLLLITGCSKGKMQTTATSKHTNNAVAGNEAKTPEATTYGDYTDEDFDETYDEATATKIELNDSGSKIEGTGASEKDKRISITSAGTYILSGSYNGQININAGNEKVHLVLDNASISNNSSSAVYVEQAKRVITTLAAESKNNLSDGTEYVFASTDETEPDAAFFSKEDLIINGKGTLEVKGNYNNGIRSKDNLVITNGTIDVTAKNNALKGKDSISIAAGTFQLKTTEGDGIQANNKTEADKGWIAIDGGDFTIQSGNDGIQAETNLSIAAANMKIKTGNGSDDNTIDATVSYKGLKASGTIVIDDGSYELDTADDSIHSNEAVTINNGTFSLASGDDGVHANTDLVINNGTISVTKSYEGLEGATVTINEGNISVIASDDGINAAGGSDQSEESGNFGPDSFGAPGGGGDSSKFIEINGGTIYVNADGDGIDSNGDVRIKAGTLVVNGPTDNGNAALDYDGTFTLDGGTVVSSGSSGMAMSASEGSSQATLSLYFNETQKAGTLINVKNTAGDTIVSVAPKKDFSHITLSSANLKVGETVTFSTGGQDSGTEKYGLYTNGSYSNGTEIATFSIENTITAVDQTGSVVRQSQMGDRPGDQPPR
ncbi:carbohydrate-binding domain-containing protein [Enterococcus sp. 4G2_DIV0659]